MPRPASIAPSISCSSAASTSRPIPSSRTSFDRIVDGVNALEMEALKQGNGFAPNEEPPPPTWPATSPSSSIPTS